MTIKKDKPVKVTIIANGRRNAQPDDYYHSVDEIKHQFKIKYAGHVKIGIIIEQEKLKKQFWIWTN